MHSLVGAPEGPQTMMNSRNVVATLRRDATFVGHAAVAIVFIGFAGLAVGAALVDLMSLR